MRVRITAALAAVLLLAAGCEGGGDPATERSASPSAHSSASRSPRPAPVRFGHRLWARHPGHGAPDSQPYAVSRVRQAQLAGGTLLYSGSDRGGAEVRLVAVDASTGVPRWSYSDESTLKPGGGHLDYPIGALYVIDGDDGPVVLVNYREGDHRVGAAALSVRTGKVLWRLRYPGEYGSVGAATDKLVLVDASNVGGVEETTIAYDATSRRELWRTPGVYPAMVVGDTVLVEHVVAQHKGRIDTKVQGLSATTGKRRWRLRKRYDTSSTRSMSSRLGNAVLLSVPGGAALIDAHDGTELATVDIGDGFCYSDTRTLLVCEPDEGGLVALHRSGGKVRRTHPGKGSLVGVLHGMAIIKDPHDSSFAVVDAAGRPFDLRVPGSLVVVGERYAVFADGENLRDGATLYGYRLRR